MCGHCCCCRKTVVCNWVQLLDFSVLELVRSQSTFSTDPEVFQNYTGFTWCSSASLAGECSAVMALTPSIMCVQIYCVLCAICRILNCEYKIGQAYVLETSVSVEHS